MKNKTGKFFGFIIGMFAFLFLFKLFIIVNIPPEDEIAPGLVLIVSLLNGILFAFFGNLIQTYFKKLS